MGYTVIYGTGKPKNRLKKKRHMLYGLCLLLLMLVGVRLAFPEHMQQLSYRLFPWSQPQTLDSIGAFFKHVGEGEPLREAIAVLCLDILQGANGC